MKYHRKERELVFKKEQERNIATKEKELENIIQALSSGAFNNNYEYCNNLISKKRKEIEVIKAQKLSVVSEQKIELWLENIKASNYTPKVFIDKIIVKKTEVDIVLTFSSVVGNLGCGGTIDMIPTILFGQKKYTLRIFCET